MKRYPKIKALYGFSVFTTSGFCHATQAIRQFALIKFLTLATWLISAWLTDAQRSKTFLEKLLKPYNAVPFEKLFLYELKKIAVICKAMLIVL